MPPRNRKSKASITAAACRQWKVGDLVLAKVKGFPAWPATVSEPKKWGYSTDWKKVLVYFFGTNQIAFCNPADVEAFTEEKKESLLVKRQNRGADFVRAVKEIIESYEKLKKQNDVDGINTGDGIVAENGGKSMDSLDDSVLKEYNEASSGALISKSNCSNSTRSPPAEDDVTPMAVDALCDKVMPLEEPTLDTVNAESPLENTYVSRRRSGGNQPEAHIIQKKALPVQNNRSSSRSDSGGFHNLKLQSHKGGTGARNRASNVLPDRSFRRTRRSRKLPDASEGCNAASAAFVSNGSTEENGSEIVTLASDTISLNGGSTLESCALEHTETSNCLEREVALDKTLNLQTKAAVIKKRRKPNRKRMTIDAVEPTDALDKAADIFVGVYKDRLNSPNACERSNERHFSEDGDEHLPLVKRARVRMGKHIDARAQFDGLRNTEEKSTNEVPSIRPSSTSLSSEDGSLDGNSIVVKESPIRSSPSDCSQFQDNKTQLLNGSKSHSYDAVDGEAVLPPSKRLHRALEAMSANAAENSQAQTEEILPTRTSDGRCDSSIVECPSVLESKTSNGLGVSKFPSIGNSDSEEIKSVHSAHLNPMDLKEPKSLSKDMVICDHSDEKVKVVKVKVKSTEALVEAPSIINSLSSVFDEKHTGPVMKQDESARSSLKNDGKSDNIGPSHLREGFPDKDPEYSNCIGVKRMDKMSELSNENDTKVLLHREKENGEHTKLLKPSLDNNNQVDGICDFLGEVEHESGQDSEKVVIDAVEGIHHLSRCPVSDDQLGGQNVSRMQSGLSSNDGVDLPARSFLSAAASLCPTISTVTSSSLSINGSYSHDVQLLHKKEVSNLDAEIGKPDLAAVSVGKLTNCTEAKAAVTSFGAILGTLIRTKDSIGRATRTAIDCAKFGLAGKVVDILARNLETEPSLPRRVDLFFLVDSIMQCSRGLKGEFSEIYPSAIQAALPRLLSAAAPPGNTAQDNRRQCLKVLRLWLERKIFPESVICHHIRILDSLSSSSSSGPFSRRSCRNERAFDDPLREMEGMLVDEYGSNSSFQLPGFCMPRMRKDEDDGSDSDGGNFEAVTPEHSTGTPEEQEATPMVERHRHILEDVDGELEMEDVAPVSEVEMSSTRNDSEINAVQASGHEQTCPPSFAPPLPSDLCPFSPPLPISPPPPSLPPPVVIPVSFANGVDQQPFMAPNNSQGNSQPYALQQPVTPMNRPPFMDQLHYHAPEQQDFQMQMGMPDSSNTCSFNNIPMPHPSVQPVKSVLKADGPNFHNNPYPLRPPHPTPSNQFSYVHADQPVPSWREVPPPPYSNRYNCRPNMDTGNYFTDHDRNNLAPHELSENCRYSGPSFSGPRFPDNHRVLFAPAPFVGPPTGMPNQRWAFPAQEMNHRNAMPVRPISEDFHFGLSAPRFWRPR